MYSPEIFLLKQTTRYDIYGFSFPRGKRVGTYGIAYGGREILELRKFGRNNYRGFYRRGVL
jgi:hypothetical protein